MMLNNDTKISAEEARQALHSIQGATNTIKENIRPPLWLNLSISSLLGLETLSLALSSGPNTDHSLWTFVMIVSTGALLFFTAGWIFSLRLNGIKVRWAAQNWIEKVIDIGSGLVIAFILMGTQYLYQNGLIWSPYVGGAINASILFYLLFKCPTGEKYT